MISVALTRALFGLEPLVIDQNPAAASGLYLPEDAVGEVAWELRRSYAPDSAWIGGKTLLAAVDEASSLPLVVYATGSTTAELEAAKALLRQAASQWAYQTTITVDGVAVTYRSEIARPRWGAVDSGMVRDHLARAVLVIPVNP